MLLFGIWDGSVDEFIGVLVEVFVCGGYFFDMVLIGVCGVFIEYKDIVVSIVVKIV